MVVAITNGRSWPTTLGALLSISLGLLSCRPPPPSTEVAPEVRAGPERDTAIDPLPAIEAMVASRDEQTQFEGISLLVAVMGAKGRERELEAALVRLTEGAATPANAAFAHFVLGEKQWRKGNVDAAARRYRSTLALEREAGDRPWIVSADLRQTEITWTKASPEHRVSTIRGLLERRRDFSERALWSYRLAVALDEVGESREADRLLERLAATRTEVVVPETGERVSSAAARRRVGARPRIAAREVAMPFGELVVSLRRSLARGAIHPDLRAASARVLSWGPVGAHPRLHPGEEVLEAIEEALHGEPRPQMTSPPLITRTPGRAYVHTAGWRLRDTAFGVSFIFEQGDGDRWHWSGITFVQEPTDRRSEWRREPEGVLEGRTGIDVLGSHRAALMAPAPTRGCNAGPGAPTYNQPSLPSTWFHRAPWAPGSFQLSGNQDIAAPVIFGACTELMGWPGSYYGRGFHTGNDYYAIDFNRWGTQWLVCPMPYPPFIIPCAIPWPRGGIEIRSVSAGIVTNVAWDQNAGIQITHLGPGGIADGYVSEYLHMSPLFVMDGQYVVEGTPLGLSSDVGNSVGEHLHYTLRFGGQTAMPSPMDNTDRDHCGERVCMASTNGGLFVDSDADGIPDSIDNCRTVANPPTAPSTEQADTDGDGFGDACDTCTDQDSDGICDPADNCPTDANASQMDFDSDGTGDVCDGDADGDGLANAGDLCPKLAHGNNADADSDGKGDPCDICPEDAADDADGDGKCADVDNCPNVANAFQRDLDGDGLGDPCDPDEDGDGIANGEDRCPGFPSTKNTDADGDGVGDVCDNCVKTPNPGLGQRDLDGDGRGDACDDDIDGDGIANEDDTCPYLANAAEQNRDGDGDGVGDACDNCPSTPNSSQVDSNFDGEGDVCELPEASLPPTEGRPFVHPAIVEIRDMIEFEWKMGRVREKMGWPVDLPIIGRTQGKPVLVKVRVEGPETLSLSVVEHGGEVIDANTSSDGRKHTLEFVSNGDALHVLLVGNARARPGETIRASLDTQFTDCALAEAACAELRR